MKERPGVLRGCSRDVCGGMLRRGGGLLEDLRYLLSRKAVRANRSRRLWCACGTYVRDRTCKDRRSCSPATRTGPGAWRTRARAHMPTHIVCMMRGKAGAIPRCGGRLDISVFPGGGRSAIGPRFHSSGPGDPSAQTNVVDWHETSIQPQNVFSSFDGPRPSPSCICFEVFGHFQSLFGGGDAAATRNSGHIRPWKMFGMCCRRGFVCVHLGVCGCKGVHFCYGALLPPPPPSLSVSLYQVFVVPYICACPQIFPLSPHEVPPPPTPSPPWSHCLGKHFVEHAGAGMGGARKGHQGAEAALVGRGTTPSLSPSENHFPAVRYSHRLPTSFAVFLNPPSSPPTNGWATNPPIHKWRIPSSKGGHVQKYQPASSFSFYPRPPPPPPTRWDDWSLYPLCSG